MSIIESAVRTTMFASIACLATAAAQRTCCTEETGQKQNKEEMDISQSGKPIKSGNHKTLDIDNAMDPLVAAMQHIAELREKLRGADGKIRERLSLEEEELAEETAALLLRRIEVRPSTRLEQGERERLRDIVRLQSESTSLIKAGKNQREKIQASAQKLENTRFSVVLSEAMVREQRKLVDRQARDTKESAKKGTDDVPQIQRPEAPELREFREADKRTLQECLANRDRCRKLYAEQLSKWQVEQEKLTQIEIELRVVEADLRWQTNGLPRLKRELDDLWEKSFRSPSSPPSSRK